jgi:hypothetical protein
MTLRPVKRAQTRSSSRPQHATAYDSQPLTGEAIVNQLRRVQHVSNRSSALVTLS